MIDLYIIASSISISTGIAVSIVTFIFLENLMLQENKIFSPLDYGNIGRIRELRPNISFLDFIILNIVIILYSLGLGIIAAIGLMCIFVSIAIILEIKIRYLLLILVLIGIKYILYIMFKNNINKKWEIK